MKSGNGRAHGVTPELNRDYAIQLLDDLFIKWHQTRGSDITLGKRLPAILREAGFINIKKCISADTKGTPETVRSHAEMTISLLKGPFGKAFIQNIWGDKQTIKQLKEAVNKWKKHPDSFFSNIHIEVIGWKKS